MPALKSGCQAVCACIGFAWKRFKTKFLFFYFVGCSACILNTSFFFLERSVLTLDQRLVLYAPRCSVDGGGVCCGVGYGLRGAAEGRPLVTDNQIGALILEDLAFPLRHNNALCAALPVSQAREEGTGRLSHSSHRFLSASLHLLLLLPPAHPPSPHLLLLLLPFPLLSNFRQCCVLQPGER